ncbi:MAG TPA: tonB-system energizer ExbB [Myxococcota bacterium]|nr:tonB-system energizer ExbB [Myxococcota bacterium]
MRARLALLLLALLIPLTPAFALAQELTPAALTPAAAPASSLARDLSVWGMFRDAGLAPKAVMVLLALCSVWNGAIFVEKALRLRAANRRADRFLAAFRAATSLDEPALDAAAGACPLAAMHRAGALELRVSREAGAALAGEARDRLRERIDAAQQLVHADAAQALGGGMSALATIGATAPFVGLFGTVWGIMTSFIGIAQTQTTNLAVVAPGIAEALLATAIGLCAAIPAVVLYNKFSRDISAFQSRLASFRSEFALALARQLDRGGI